jgi:hypothetical protein
MSAVMGGGAGLFGAEAARRAGIRPSMAAIRERALTWPDMLPRVISGSRSAISPEAGEDPVAALVEPVLLVSILLDKLLANGSAMLKQVGADTRLGFDVPDSMLPGNIQLTEQSMPVL